METKLDKGKKFGLLGAVNCERINMWGKLMEDKGYLLKLCLFPLILVLSSPPVIKVILPSLVEERKTLSQREFIPCFRQIEGRQRAFDTSVSQLPSLK